MTLKQDFYYTALVKDLCTGKRENLDVIKRLQKYAKPQEILRKWHEEGNQVIRMIFLPDVLTAKVMVLMRALLTENQRLHFLSFFLQHNFRIHSNWHCVLTTYNVCSLKKCSRIFSVVQFEFMTRRGVENYTCTKFMSEFLSYRAQKVTRVKNLSQESRD